MIFLEISSLNIIFCCIPSPISPCLFSRSLYNKIRNFSRYFSSFHSFLLKYISLLSLIKKLHFFIRLGNYKNKKKTCSAEEGLEFKFKNFVLPANKPIHLKLHQPPHHIPACPSEHDGQHQTQPNRLP